MTKRIPKSKDGQDPDTHSDLYTDEDPKGTIHGLGFTDAAKARESVTKIEKSDRTHAHKVQAAIAMSQRAKVASKRANDPEKKKNLAAAAEVYFAFLEKMKKITKAVFPVAGMGTRFLPATKVSPKEMLPIVDKPLIQYAVEEAIAAVGSSRSILLPHPLAWHKSPRPPGAYPS